MANYVLVYHGGSMPESPEEGAKVMAAWTSWFGTLGDALVDGGNPASRTKTIGADGSVSDDMPAKRLARLYGVNHYVVSQTNPHVIPFVTDSKRRQDTLGVWKDAGTKTARALVNASATTLEKPLSLSPALSRMTNLWLSVINQDYVGDINILPANRYFNPFRVLAFLTETEIRDLVRAGEHATWPKVEMIRIQTRISRTLNRILSEFRRDPVIHVKGAQRKRPR